MQFDLKFVLYRESLDIETTGGKYDEEGITEIAIYKHDGESITDQFSSLVNPQIKIQPFVQKLTGISSKSFKLALPTNSSPSSALVVPF